jgi:putative ABC transport system substrate-binding protein
MDMKRRVFIALAGGSLACPQILLAQSGGTHRVGLGFQVAKSVAKPLEDAFVAGLRDHGHVAGKNLVIDVRYADGDTSKLPAIADELIALKPDVLAGFESIARVMKARTSTIPIVLTNSTDPVGVGLAQSLGRPGGNVTGISSQYADLPPKTIEILREILPRLSRVGLLLESAYPGSKAIEDSARTGARKAGATLVPYYLGNLAELEKAFVDMEKARPDALLVGGGGVISNLWGLIVANCQRLKIPFSTGPGVSGEAGALFLFGPSLLQAYRDAARYVDKILKGAKPSDLPIEQPTKFELVINIKTARALGLKIPQAVMLRADRVIE